MTLPSRKITVAEIKQAILAALDIRGYYQQFVSAKYTLVQDSSDGYTNKVNCPLCGGGHDTACFAVNLENSRFNCFSCGRGGSVFDFWLILNGKPVEGDSKAFGEALLAIAHEANFNIEAYRLGHANTQLSGGLSSGKSGPDKLVPVPSAAKQQEIYINKADENDKANHPIADTVVKRMQEALRPEHVQYLNQVRGFTKKTIDELRLGWDVNANVKDEETGVWLKGRYTIPIPDKHGLIRNIRQYSNRSDPAYKMINYVTDKKLPSERKYGSPARLYMLHELMKGEYQNIVLCGGEFKAILLNQRLQAAGLKSWLAVTGTGGERTFEGEWLQYFYGKNVFICLDCDEKGKGYAVDIFNKFFLLPMEQGKFLGVKIVTLPLEGTKDSNDITDFFMKSKLDIQDFLRLCTETPEVIAGGLDHDDASVDAIEVSDFVTAIKDRRFIDQRITVPITISGATSKIYHAIRSYRVVRCPLLDKADECCHAKQEECTIQYGHPLFIEACMAQEFSLLKSLAAMACEKEQNCRVRAVKKVVMEQYFAHQVIDRWKIEEDKENEGFSKNSQELSQAAIYVLQPPDNTPIESQNYQATGWIRTHPKTSAATFFVETLVPLEDDWKKFKAEAPEHQDLLRTLKNDFTTEQMISEITSGVTRIYESEEILYTVLLTYLSPLRFFFNGAVLRGWLNSAIIGDSGMGKTATYTRFADWIEVGDSFSALSGSRTGLLYSIKEKNDEWYVNAGIYVHCSGKILCIDETQKMLAEEICLLAIAMDTGTLKVNRVASGGYRTQTRALFLLNPKDRNQRAVTISDFSYGCEALRLCFEPMFIRRLDLAIFTSGKHSCEFYNQFVENKTIREEMRLTSKMMRTLVYWAWTRKMEHIHWTLEGTKACLQSATELSKIFGDTDQIPLVNPQSYRETLARLAVAYAILSRNFTEDFQGVTVEPRHVHFVANFVKMIYSAPSCNLHQHSVNTKMRTTLDDFEKIDKAFKDTIIQLSNSGIAKFREVNPFVQILVLIQNLGTVRQSDLSDSIGVSRGWIQRRLAILQGFNLIELTREGMKSTRKFNLFMQRWRQNPEIDKLMREVNENLGKYALAHKDDDPYDPEDYTPAPAQNHFKNDPFTVHAKK